MVTATLDIDCDSPYALARELFTLANHRCVIRLSANKGTHMKIFDLTPSMAHSIRERLDDPYRVQLDSIRYRHDKKLCTNILWDRKGNRSAGIWVEWTTRALAFWLLQDTGYSLRDAIVNLFNVNLLREFDKKVVAIVAECGHDWLPFNQYEEQCVDCGTKRDI